MKNKHRWNTASSIISLQITHTHTRLCVLYVCQCVPENRFNIFVTSWPLSKPFNSGVKGKYIKRYLLAVIEKKKCWWRGVLCLKGRSVMHEVVLGWTFRFRMLMPHWHWHVLMSQTCRRHWRLLCTTTRYWRPAVRWKELSAGHCGPQGKSRAGICWLICIRGSFALLS